jgi:hypothetical protein
MSYLDYSAKQRFDNTWGAGSWDSELRSAYEEYGDELDYIFDGSISAEPEYDAEEGAWRCEMDRHDGGVCLTRLTKMQWDLGRCPNASRHYKDDTYYLD